MMKCSKDVFKRMGGMWSIFLFSFYAQRFETVTCVILKNIRFINNLMLIKS